MTQRKTVVLCILDGWGLNANQKGNAPALADTPVFDKLLAENPSSCLTTHGPDVGLPSGQMGNSEVGHTNIGAGRVVAMDLGQIDLSIEDGSFAEQSSLKDFLKKTKTVGGNVHVIGLVSDGGVHSHINHMLAAANAIQAAGLKSIIHAITDGRDVPPKSAEDYLHILTEKLPKDAKMGSISGRYYALDRDNRWERVKKAYQAIVQAEPKSQMKPAEFIEAEYNEDRTDEFFLPHALPGYEGIEPGDSLFFLNFRADRARQILLAICDPKFDEFPIGDRPEFSAKLGMVDYSDHHRSLMDSLFPKKKIKNTLGEWVSAQGRTQFRLAETEKYPHVTFFLNGGLESPFEGEERHMPASPKVATYDQKPEMSAEEVGDRLVHAIETGYDLIVVNFANPDMVGHTGSLEAAMKACEAVDAQLGKAIQALESVGGTILVTADHGNCEVMIDPVSGEPHTAHTTNLVPLVLAGSNSHSGLANGKLGDLAPTVLELMDLEQPSEMTGRSLLR